jgi:hypothetical protein
MGQETEKEKPNCPKCGRAEIARRGSRGRTLSICGNGHDWDQREIDSKPYDKELVERRENTWPMSPERVSWRQVKVREKLPEALDVKYLDPVPYSQYRIFILADWGPVNILKIYFNQDLVYDRTNAGGDGE